jgi:ABC-type Na+ efflux pump permease subunit
VGQITLPSKENTVKILTWSAAGRLFGFVAGFIGFYLVASTFFPPENEIDSIALVIPFFLSACAAALIGGWLGSDLLGQFGRAWRRRQQ